MKGSFNDFVSTKMPKTISSVSSIFWWIIGGKVFRKKLTRFSGGFYVDCMAVGFHHCCDAKNALSSEDEYT